MAPQINQMLILFFVFSCLEKIKLMSLDDWFQQYVVNNDVFISEVTLRLTDIERQRFHEQITLYSRQYLICNL